VVSIFNGDVSLESFSVLLIVNVTDDTSDLRLKKVISLESVNDNEVESSCSEGLVTNVNDVDGLDLTVLAV
jgi:hypothetical protein